MKRVAIIGHFAYGFEYLDGQTIKTKIISKEMRREFGDNEVEEIDTHGGWTTLCKAPFQVFSALRDNRNVIMMPAHNGLRVYAPLLKYARKFFRKRKLHYIVIGGWLPEFIKKHKFTCRCLKTFDCIYVETTTMKKSMEKEGFTNICVMPNCKKLRILSKDELVFQYSEPYKICTFSRVLEQKGIEDAVNAVQTINHMANRVVYTLDIYGPVDSGEKEWFNKLRKDFPEYINYMGSVSADKSIDVLKNYFILLFPTHFYTEGVPGTIIDAYAAGIPVVSSRWESFEDIIDEGTTGFGFSFGSVDDLVQVLYRIAQSPQLVSELKPYCLDKAKEYMPEKIANILTIGGDNQFSLD